MIDFDDDDNFCRPSSLEVLQRAEELKNKGNHAWFSIEDPADHDMETTADACLQATKPGSAAEGRRAEKQGESCLVQQ